jgi:hypothetical protein
VRDHNAQQLAYVYFKDEPGRRSVAKLLTKDEARRIAANIASCRTSTNQSPSRLCALDRLGAFALARRRSLVNRACKPGGTSTGG